MPVLIPGRPFLSRDPVLLVENRLAPGAATFALTVLDEDGNVSAPAQLRVTVVRSAPPVPPQPPSRQPTLEQPVSPPVRRRRIIQP